MASEYLKWKYKDVKPDAKRELTPEEKRKNWWYYYKWHVVVAIVLVLIAADLVWGYLGRGEPKPDYQIAYVGTNALPDDTAAAVEAAFAGMGEDLNGDGKVVARLVQYASSGGTDAQTVMAAEVRLLADLSECESYFFLLENPERFQLNYGSLRRVDGSLPVEAGSSGGGEYLAWERCPVLAGIELGEYAYPFMGETVTGSSNDLLSTLYIARRGFWEEKTTPHPEGCDALWEKITEGAVS